MDLRSEQEIEKRGGRKGTFAVRLGIESREKRIKWRMEAREEEWKSIKVGSAEDELWSRKREMSGRGNEVKSTNFATSQAHSMLIVEC